MEYSLATEKNKIQKKNKILPFAIAWMDLEGIMLSEISQRKTNTIQFHLCVEPKEQTKQNWNRFTDTENEQMVAGEGAVALLEELG